MKHLYQRKRKSQIAIYLILLFAVVLGMVLMRRCGSHNPYSRKSEGGSGADTLDVAIIYGPLSYFIYADTLGGLNYDLLRDLSVEMGRPVKFWPVVSLSKSLEMLKSGKYDLLASLPTDASMKSDFAFTEPLFLDRQILIQRKNKDGTISVESGLDLADDTIHIEADSPVRSRLRNLSNEIGRPIHIVEHSDLSAEYIFYKVASGDFRYAVINERIARPLLEKYPQVSIDTPVSFTQFQSWVVARSDTVLLHLLDDGISEYKRRDRYKSLLRRYDTPPVSE